MNNKNAVEQHIEQALVPKPSQAKLIEQRFYDDFDDVYKYYTDKSGLSKLSEKQEEQLGRWRWIREWIVSWQADSDREIIEAIITEFSISERQAYIDLKNTKRFFSSMETVEKEHEKSLMITRLKRNIKALQADGSIKARIAMVKAEELLSKIMGIQEPEHQQPVPVVVTVTPVFDPSILGVEEIDDDRLEKLLKAFGKKKEEERRLEVEDVDFEMIMNGKST